MKKKIKNADFKGKITIDIEDDSDYIYLTIVDNDDDTLKKGGFAWRGLSAIYQLE